MPRKTLRTQPLHALANLVGFAEMTDLVVHRIRTGDPCATPFVTEWNVGDTPSLTHFVPTGRDRIRSPSPACRAIRVAGMGLLDSIGAEILPPLAEGQVGGDDVGASLKALREQVEEPPVRSNGTNPGSSTTSAAGRLECVRRAPRSGSKRVSWYPGNLTRMNNQFSRHRLLSTLCPLPSRPLP